jgi:2-amino-4-hydroxy-6-hydroxymethyldihydropteridine diphosphokinase
LVSDEKLTLPHPRAHERRFVLAPWFEIEPEAILLTHGRISDLLNTDLE